MKKLVEIESFDRAVVIKEVEGGKTLGAGTPRQACMKLCDAITSEIEASLPPPKPPK